MILNSKKIKIRPKLLNKIKWGVAGCSDFAENYFLPALQLVQRSKLISLYSHNLKRAESLAGKFGAQNYYDDYDSFLKSDINAVYISSATVDHYEQVIRAAKAGKNILCERPFAVSSQEAAEMIKACKENNVKLVINHVPRVHPLIQKVKELIDKQMLGKIISISAQMCTDYPATDSFRIKKKLSGGGVLRDLGTPIIDLMQFIGGEIVEVKAYMDNLFYKSDVEDFVSAIMKFEKGGYGNFTLSYDCKKSISKLEIIGYKGSMSIESELSRRNRLSKLTIDLHGERRKIFRKRSNKMILLLRSVQRTFLKDESHLACGEDAVNVLKIIEQIEKQSSQ